MDSSEENPFEDYEPVPEADPWIIAFFGVLTLLWAHVLGFL